MAARRRRGALGAGSAALDAVPPSGADCQPTDQRGVARPQAFGCDTGAFEAAPPGVTTGPASDITLTSATVSGTVTPNGPATWFVEYGPTTAYGSRTPDADAGRATSPVPVSAALTGLPARMTIHYRFVATNAYGTVTGADQTFFTEPPSDMTDPRFLSARVVPKTFRVNRKGRAERPARAGAKRGTRFRYSLSEAARVVFTIGRSMPGRRVGRRCVKVTRSNRGRRKCKRFPAVGRFAQSASAGANTKRFSGRIGRRSLRPGRYRATLVATDAAHNASRPRRLAFRVVRW